MKNHFFKSFFLVAVSVVIIHATTFAPTTLKKLSSSSDLIVIGKVESVSSSWDDSHERIYTFANVNITEVVKGKNAPATVMIKQLGGTVGDQSLVIHASPEFEKNQEVLLFLVFHQDRYWIHSLAMGKYDIIEEDGQRIVQNKIIGEELVKLETESIEKLSEKYQKYPLQQFVNQVRFYSN